MNQLRIGFWSLTSRSTKLINIHDVCAYTEWCTKRSVLSNNSRHY